MPTNLAYTTTPIDVRRYGIVPNSSVAASANTAALKALLNPNKTGPTGLLVFPNTTGADIYYFNGVVPIRDGIHIDLLGSTISYTAAAAAADVNSGLFFALRNFSCANGTISVAVDTSSASSCGYAIKAGARGAESRYFTVYDSSLSAPLGNVTLRNLNIVLANTGKNPISSGAIALTGGLQNVVIENVRIDGGGNVGHGIVYEFGWATPGATHMRQTSHAHNMRFTNVTARNLDTAAGYGLVIAGAYSCFVDGLHVSSAAGALSVTSGESLFYRPWAGVDTAGVKHAITLRNVIGERLHSTGIVFAGAQLASGGYLGSLIKGRANAQAYLAETDLGAFCLDGFALDNSGNPGNGWGIQLQGAARVDIRNGSISGGFTRGIVGTDETMNFSIDAVRIFGCRQTGIQLDIGSAIWSPPRLKKGEISNCYIAGNGTSQAGAFPAISLNTCQNVLICNNRLGYESGYAGSAETSQGNGISLGPAAHNVICDCNHIAVAGPGAGYSATASTAQGNAIRSASGVTTTHGPWERAGVAFGSAADIADQAHALNTSGKYPGRCVFDTSNNRIMVSLGYTATSKWQGLDAATSVAPS
ncbi:MAG: hypothetical protein ACREVV_12355 [Steroidobacteraceae bacterium]